MLTGLEAFFGAAERVWVKALQSDPTKNGLVPHSSGRCEVYQIGQSISLLVNIDKSPKTRDNLPLSIRERLRVRILSDLDFIKLLN